MLDYNILSQKSNVSMIKDDKKIEMKDLLSKSYKGINVGSGRIIVVNKYYVARPDLISLAVYGDDKYADVICKVNGISNPFELNENMTIYIPDITDVSGSFMGTQYVSDVLDSAKTKNSKKLETLLKSETIEKNTTLNGKQKLKNERRTPGDQTISDTNYTIDRTLGLVIY